MTGVQTCALPILGHYPLIAHSAGRSPRGGIQHGTGVTGPVRAKPVDLQRPPVVQVPGNRTAYNSNNHGQASPLNGSNYLTPNIQIGNWFGMKGKGSIHHSEACCTGYLAIEQAVNAVASGKYNCVLTGAVEFGDSTPSPADSVETPKQIGRAHV